MNVENSESVKRRVDQLNLQVVSDALSDLDEQYHACVEARQLATELVPPYEKGYAHSLVAEAYWSYRKSHYLKVIYAIAQVETAYESLEFDDMYLEALYLSGLTFHILGQTTEALEAHQQQALVARSLDNRAFEASALRRIGVEHDTLGNLVLAGDYYNQSLALYESIGNQGGMAGVLTNMAILFRKQGDIAKSIAYAQQALDIFKRIESTPGIITASGQLAMGYIAQKDYEKALGYVQSALESAKKSNSSLMEVTLNIQLGKVYSGMEQYVLAQSVLENALKMARQNSDLINESECLISLSEMYENMHDFDLALEYYKEYHEIQIKLRDKASKSRFELLEIQHRTQQAQIEAATERQLRQQDRLYFEKLSRMKDEILSTASHDLKNPIASLMLVVHLLKKHGRLDDKRGEELLERMDHGLNQMRNLITNLLDLARLETGKSISLGRHDIVHVVNQMVKSFAFEAHEKNIQLDFQFQESSFLLNIDEVAIQQVMANLLSNALKFTPGGGRVLVNIECVASDVRVSVKDSGPGIPADDIPKLFERFYRVNDEKVKVIEGTGLGLAICKTIIDQHSGKIWVESEEGKGTIFYFSLSA